MARVRDREGSLFILTMRLKNFWKGAFCTLLTLAGALPAYAQNVPVATEAAASSPKEGGLPSSDEAPTVSSDETAPLASDEATLTDEGEATAEASGTDVLTPADCLSHHELAQVFRFEGKLLKSEQELRICSHPTCPEVVRNDCSEWQEELIASVPSIVVRARGDVGDLAVAQVFVDGELVSDKLDGKALRLDPGLHLVRVELESGEFRELKVILSEGGDPRLVETDFRKPASSILPRAEPPPPREEAVKMVATRPLLIPGHVLLAVSAVSLGVGIGFGIDAISEQKSAEDLCSPVCDPAVSERVSRSATISDIAFGTAIVTGLGAAALYLLGPVVYRPEKSGRTGKSPSFALRMGMNSGTVTARGTF